MDSSLPLLILLLAFAPIHAEQSGGFVLNGWKAGLTAEELRAFARASRITSEDFFPDYPDKPILSTIAIGTPGVNFSVALESGSTTAFVLDATYASLQPGQPSYNASLSSTSKAAGSFDGFTGESEVYGHAYEDVFTWFAHGSEFTVTQYFGAANSVSYGWFTDPALNGIDGVVGLSWNPGELQADRVAPIVNLLDLLGGERTYTQWLTEAVDEQGAHGYQVALAFGRSLDDHCDSTTLNYVPLVYIDDVQSLVFQLDTLFMDQFRFQGGKAKVDTGVPTFIMPHSPFVVLVGLADAHYDFSLNLYMTDCESAHTLPDWTFAIGGRNYTVPSKKYVIDLGLDNGDCVLSALSNGEYTTDYILGTLFNTLYCCTMDVGKTQMGLLTAMPATVAEK